MMHDNRWIEQGRPRFEFSEDDAQRKFSLCRVGGRVRDVLFFFFI